jgi:catechol 2,3-dioxygenase-like lactoylglutathione lyase family enzyme
LPLANLGLEHLDIIVPDPAASARFYTRIFKSALHQQPVRDTLRYFVLLGELPADTAAGPGRADAAGVR